MITRARAAVAISAAVATASLAAPADANAPLILHAIGSPTVRTYNVTPECHASAGTTTNFNEITYVVQGSATSYSTNGSLPIATGISCWIVDLRTNVVYGPLSLALPGGNAVVAGTLTIPLSSLPKLCARGNAIFTDNGTVSATGGC